MKKYDIDNCKVEAKKTDGETIVFDIKHLRYDEREDIYWYQDMALKDIKIIVNYES